MNIGDSNKYIEFEDYIDENYWEENGFFIEDHSIIRSKNDLDLIIDEIKEELNNKISYILNEEILLKFNEEDRNEILNMNIFITKIDINSSLIRVLEIYKNIHQLELKSDGKEAFITDLLPKGDDKSIITNNYGEIEYLTSLLDRKKDLTNLNLYKGGVEISTFLKDNYYLLSKDIINSIIMIIDNETFEKEHTYKYEYIINKLLEIKRNHHLNNIEINKLNIILCFIISNYFKIFKGIKKNGGNIFITESFIEICKLHITNSYSIEQLLGLHNLLLMLELDKDIIKEIDEISYNKSLEIIKNKNIKLKHQEYQKISRYYSFIGKALPKIPFEKFSLVVEGDKFKNDTESKIAEFIVKNFPNLEFKSNFYIYGMEMDFYFPKFKINIEIDGLHHGNNFRKITIDKKRDEILKSKGIQIYRINSGGKIKHLEKIISDTMNIHIKK